MSSDIEVTVSDQCNVDPIDTVELGLNPTEDMEFNTDHENVDSDNESLPEQESENDQVEYETVTTPTEELNPCDRDVDVESVVTFKQSNGDQLNFEQLSNNPAFVNYVQKLVAKQVRDKRTKNTPKSTPKNTPKKGNLGEASSNLINVTKSPSDTTIYAPALQKITNRACQNLTTDAPLFSVDNISKFIEGIRVQQEDRHREQ